MQCFRFRSLNQYRKKNSNPPLSQKCVFLLVAPVECLSFTVEDDVCAEAAAGSLPSHPLQKVQILSLLTDNLILGGGADKLILEGRPHVE